MALATAAAVLTTAACVYSVYEIWHWYIYEKHEIEEELPKPSNDLAREQTKGGKEDIPSPDEIERKLLDNTGELVGKVRDELKNSVLTRLCTFNITNQTKNHDIMLKQHLAQRGDYVKTGKELDPIKPQEKGSFMYKGCLCCSGVLVLSMHCSCDRCTGDSEFVAVIFFRNKIDGFFIKKPNKFAVEFMDKYVEVNKDIYRTMNKGKKFKLACSGPMKIEHKHVSLSIHMGTDRNAVCDVKVEETEH